jgi:uncharacterized protein with HEPN domain
MLRDVLLLQAMIDSAEQAHVLVEGASVDELGAQRQRRDALLWNFTVLGEASGQVSLDLKEQFAEVPWQQPSRLRNRIVHGYWSIGLGVLHATALDQLPAFVAELRRVLAAVIAEDEVSTPPEN